MSKPDPIITNSSIDPKSGFCSKTNTYHSIRPAVPLPPDSAPISVTSYIFSLLDSHPPPPSAAAINDASTRRHIPYPDFVLRIKALAFSLRTKFDLSKGDVAFVLSPNSIHIPVLYLSLMYLGVVVSPSNPSGTKPEILRLIRISKPVIAFATSETAHKIPSLEHGTVLLDSPEFESLTTSAEELELSETDRARVRQSDAAVILYSSGTTGMVKGVVLSHRNWIASLAAAHAVRKKARDSSPAVAMCTVPYFHVYGFRYSLTALAMGETLVFMGGTGRFELGVMLRAIEELRVRHVAASPPVVTMLALDGGGVISDGYDLSSLEVVGCGGAYLTLGVIDKFRKRLPTVQLAQAYGMTESTGRVFGTVGPEECKVAGATGKLMSNCEAKIVDPETGIPQPPAKPGEIWLRGSLIMKGYVGDEEATAAILDGEGWLRTGDLGYIDREGFLFYVDRIKELIKYKGYQVAPAELEHQLHSHPDIVDAAVVPYLDERVGQVPVAFVVRKHGSTIDESEIKEFIAKQVASYKKIRRVIFISSIPRNSPGKVLRKDLTKLALSNSISKL
ncbi:hypothetical protein Q3G72_025820 [Acer saccharum]|nr:hypothetical protein Q3G72_025820 [Acer saccharum]